MMKFLLAVLGVVGVALLSVSPAGAQEKTLRFATTNSARAHLNVHVLHPWAKRINDQGKGLLKIDVRDGPVFANPANYFERARAGVSQIGWGVQAVLGGKFIKSGVVGLPFVADKSEYASLAYWRLYKSGLLDSEYEDTVVLYLNVFPQGGLHFRSKPASIETLDGLKIITGGRTSAALIKALGGAPLSLGLGGTYEALQRGTADGNMMMFTAFQPFKLAEVTSYHVNANLGTSGGWVFMMRKEFETLSKAQRDLIMANSGEKQSLAFGKFWDFAEITGRKGVASDPKHTIVDLPPEIAAAWKREAFKIIDGWAKSVPDGAAILARFREEIEKAKAGN